MDTIALNQAIAQDLAVLNEQITFHDKRAVASRNDSWRTKLHVQTADKLRLVVEHITMLQAALAGASNQPKPIKIGQQLTLTIDEIQGLPPELIKELSIDTESLDFVISSLINEAGGILSLDKLIIGLYKKTGEIHKRTNINNRLYRMTQRGEVFSIPGKRAAYSTRELTSEEVEQLINPTQPPTSEVTP